MNDAIESIRQAHAAGTCLSGACVWHEHVGALLSAFDGRNNDALSMELQRDQALRELTALRGENERLKRSFAPRYDGNRDIAAVIEHLRFGDADGDDHDAAAAEIERLQSQLAALRRPLEQSAEVEAIRAEHIRCQQGGCFGERQEERQTLLSALDQAHREIQQLIANHENREDQMEAEIARLSIPPQERKEIVERQRLNRTRKCYFHHESEEMLADIDTLLGDCAAWRNALAVSRAKCERLEQQQVIIQGAHDHALQTMRRAEISHGQRIERLEGAINEALLCLMPAPFSDKARPARAYFALQAALAASQQHTAGTGDGVEGE